jgi:hypothetical protein
MSFKKGTFLKVVFFSLFLFIIGANLSSAAGLVPCGGTNEPRCTLCHLLVGIKGLIDFGLTIVTTLAFAGIFFAGVQYIISAGDSKMTSEAKGYLTRILIGFALAYGAWLIINVAMWGLATRTVTDPGGGLGIQKTSWFSFNCYSAQTSAPASAPASAPVPARVAAPAKTPSGTTICQNNNNADCPAGMICNMYVTEVLVGSSPGGLCVAPGGDNYGCKEVADCQANFKCDSNNRCKSTAAVAGATCDSKGACPSGLKCVGSRFGAHPGLCYAGNKGDPCCSDSGCSSGKCSNKWYSACLIENTQFTCL